MTESVPVYSVDHDQRAPNQCLHYFQFLSSSLHVTDYCKFQNKLVLRAIAYKVYSNQPRYSSNICGGSDTALADLGELTIGLQIPT